LITGEIGSEIQQDVNTVENMILMLKPVHRIEVVAIIEKLCKKLVTQEISSNH
jgi:hypothetical protein